MKETSRYYFTSAGSKSNGFLSFHDYKLKFPKHYWTSGYFSLGNYKKLDGLYWSRKRKFRKVYRSWRYRRWAIRREWYGYFYPTKHSRF